MDLELVLNAKPNPSPPQLAARFVSRWESNASGNGRLRQSLAPAELDIAPSPLESLRVAREQTGVNASVCLDGYCPVQLSQQTKWANGDAAISAVCQGRTYWFSSDRAKGVFLQQPDTYAAVMSGYDPVLLLDENRLEEGKRECGIWYRDRVYPFSGEPTLQKFSQQTDAYVSAARKLEDELADPTRQLVAKPVVDSGAPNSGENNPCVFQTRIDLIELNHVQDQDGRPVFDQLILWSTYPDGKLHIRDWRLQKTSAMLPTRQADFWVCPWIQRQKGSASTDELIVAAPAFREATPVIDPELEDRKEVQGVARIPLWKR